jgi:hypothetical protein
MKTILPLLQECVPGAERPEYETKKGRKDFHVIALFVSSRYSMASEPLK